MKKTYLILLATFVISLSTIKNASASHGMGGEITWKCLGNGLYVFQIKLYRDCNGVLNPGSIDLTTTVPGLASISAAFVSVTDISHTGFWVNGTSPCFTCAQGNISNPLFGIVEENIYETAPTLLNGIPPTTGWSFSYETCCRSNSISNIVDAGTLGFKIEAKMFSYNGQNADPCFDSSPQFAEQPNAIICTGLPIVYNQLASDAEMDSLVYQFDAPLDDIGNPIPLAPGYTIQNPLPDTLTLNPATGECSFNSTIAGNYVMVIKVSAYKCGFLVSEIRREINVLISNNCAPVLNGQNLAPVVSAPFIDPVTSLYTSYADTVIAGDTVNATIAISDFDLFLNSGAQTITINSFGQQYGANFTNPLSGCLNPPCATLTPPSPISGYFAMTQDFQWVTSPAHLGYSLSCVQFSNTHYFLNKVKDNYCPANASSTRVFSVTVLPAIPPPPIVNNGATLECTLGSTYTYQWYYNRFAIPGASASSYTPSLIGTYHILAIAPDGQGNYSSEYIFNPLGMLENDFVTDCSIQPNPSVDGIFNLHATVIKDSRLSINVFDIYGKSVYINSWISNADKHSFKIDLTSQSVGVYVLELRNENSIVQKLKLVKSK